MKKLAISLAVLFLFCVFTIGFTACDKNETRSITIHIKNETFKIECQVGDDLSDFDPQSIIDIRIDSNIISGLFYDENCLFKYDQSKPIDHDMTLYAGVYHLSPDLVSVNFVFENQQYILYQQSNYPLTVFDFIATAYGKSISPACLEFYSDAEMQNQFDLVGLNYQTECEQEYAFAMFGKYTIYVKRVPAPTIDN